MAVLTALGIYFAASVYYSNRAVEGMRQDIIRLEKMIQQILDTNKPSKEQTQNNSKAEKSKIS